MLLPGLRVSAVQEMQLQMAGSTRQAETIPRHCAPYSEEGTGVSDILARLWTHMVEPILSYLNVSYFNLCPCLSSNQYIVLLHV